MGQSTSAVSTLEGGGVEPVDEQRRRRAGRRTVRSEREELLAKLAIMKKVGCQELRPVTSSVTLPSRGPVELRQIGKYLVFPVSAEAEVLPQPCVSCGSHFLFRLVVTNCVDTYATFLGEREAVCVLPYYILSLRMGLLRGTDQPLRTTRCHTKHRPKSRTIFIAQLTREHCRCMRYGWQL